ncbi:uncharacterized protein LOC141599249 isoform X1 [Silene latifolia]|uniref:uncharacterized protein LOC141599249 isoform X1 n=1 Tax=Silene latifolia TaxID=37657 RepID=UPI003D770971
MTIMFKGLESLQEERKAADVVEYEAAVKVYLMDELNEATNNFNHMSLIAESSYASVFRAFYKTGPPTAVKILYTSNAQDSDADFAAQGGNKFTAQSQDQILRGTYGAVKGLKYLHETADLLTHLLFTAVLDQAMSLCSTV